jgi:hypothetical protein
MIKDIVRGAMFEEFKVFTSHSGTKIYEIVFGTADRRYWRVRVNDKFEDACYPATGVVWGKLVEKEWKYKQDWVERKV